MKLNTISEKNQKQSPDLVKMENAKELYLKAIEYSNDPGPIMRKLLFVYIDIGNNQKAIDYSNEILSPKPFNSCNSTLNDSGIPGFGNSFPFTMLSNA